ncbi:MAG: hypothetical protein QM479_13190, partial [Pseudomonadota bacterium]
TDTDVNETDSINSGDAEYLSHTTTNTARVSTDSNGHANTWNSQDVSVMLNNQHYAMASMPISVSSGDDGEDVNDTWFSMTLDAMGGTIWAITEHVNNFTASTKSVDITSGQATSYATRSSSSTAYNPQDEIVWTYCASENETCFIEGREAGTLQVRYGSHTSERWLYKQISSYVDCNKSTWGDPAKGEGKACEYMKVPSYAPTWTFCGHEGDTCSNSEPENVRFGINKDWIGQYPNGDVWCHAYQFGDPMPGQYKLCETMTDAGAPPLNYEYVHCANEGETCNFNGSAVVRYGVIAGGALFYVYNIKRDSVVCNNDIAGDPLHNVSKSCDYLRYIDPNTRYDATDQIWSTKDVSIPANLSGGGVTEVGGEEKVIVEVGFSKGWKMYYFGVSFTATVSVNGEVGLKVNGYLDSANRTFSLIGGPYVNVDSAATGKFQDEPFHTTEVGITAPIAVMDLYSPFTVALTVKPGVLTADISLDYFLDLLAGDVVIYYHYDVELYSDNDSETIYHWDPLYQTTGNIFKGTKTWEISPVTDYILPSIPDGYFKQKIGYSTPVAGRDYYLELAGDLTSNAVLDPNNPNEFVNVDIVCGNDIVKSMTFTGSVNERIKLDVDGSCTEVVISGIRPTSWPEGNRLTFGVREQ